MRRTQEEAEATRRAVLAAALRLFSEKGYAATRLSDVAAAAGVTRGAIYHHFDNKADLYRTLLQGFSEQFTAQVAAAIREGGSFLEICRRVMVEPLAYLERDPEFAAFYELVQFHTVDIPELSGAHREQMGQVGAVLENIARYFRAGVEQGVVRPALNPNELAGTFVALQNGLIHLWLLRERAFSLSQAAATAAEVFIEGMVSREGG